MQVRTITLLGAASRKTTYLKYTDEQVLMDLLSFLRANEIPIASSCKGRSTCKKCKFNGDVLACETNIEDLVNSFEGNMIIDYL